MYQIKQLTSIKEAAIKAETTTFTSIIKTTRTTESWVRNMTTATVAAAAAAAIPVTLQSATLC